MHEPYTGVASVVIETNTSNDNVQQVTSEINGGTTDVQQVTSDVWTPVEDMIIPFRPSDIKLCRYYSFLLIMLCIC